LSATIGEFRFAKDGIEVYTHIKAMVERHRKIEDDFSKRYCGSAFVPAWLPSLGWWAIAAMRAPICSVEGEYTQPVRQGGGCKGERSGRRRWDVLEGSDMPYEEGGRQGHSFQ
ncbi:hypothetical protein PV325_010418, partial [Microctonus aethiopoides]